jgi:NADPH-dependent 7-cyano-7-deazaguanine reductase QueF
MEMMMSIGRGYDLEPEDGTDVTVLEAVTYLMVFKSIYSFSNQCCNDIVKLIIDLICNTLIFGKNKNLVNYLFK